MGFLSSIPGIGMLDSFLHPQRGYKKAQQQYDKYYQQGQDYLQPYSNQGQEAYGNLSGAMNALLDPAALQNQWASGYETSPYAQQMMERTQNQGLNAASSMGLMGSSPALQAIQANTSFIGNQDRQNYLDNLMQKYMAGAQLAQGIYGTGAQAGGQMSQNAMNMGNNSAQMAYGQQNAPGNLFGNLLGTVAGMNMGAGNTIGSNQNYAQPLSSSHGWSTRG